MQQGNLSVVGATSCSCVCVLRISTRRPLPRDHSGCRVPLGDRVVQIEGGAGGHGGQGPMRQFVDHTRHRVR